MASLLTIITITYNAGSFLERTLLSVERAFEMVADKTSLDYIIVDGGSTDETLSIASRYGRIISKLDSEPDRGLYDAMNKGLARATGKYVWFLNAGDEIADDQVLSRLIPHLLHDAGVLYSDALFIRPDGRVVGLRSEHTPHSLPKNLHWTDMALGMKVCHQAFIARRDIAPQYDIANLSADLDWEITCLKRSLKVQYLDFILCRYLLGGLSVQNHRRSLIDRWRVLRKHFGVFTTLVNHVKIGVRGVTFLWKRGKYW